MKCECEKKEKLQVQSMETTDLEEAWDVFETNFFILFGIFTSIFETILSSLTLQDLRKYPLINSFRSIVYSIAPLYVNYMFKIYEQDAYLRNHILHPFNQVLLKLRKNIMRPLITLNILPLLLNFSYFGEKTFVGAQINQENPYNSKSVCYDGDLDSSFLLGALEENCSLTDEEKNQVIRLRQYFQENPYLNMEQVYLNLATLDIFYENNKRAEKEKIIAQYFDETNTVYIYNRASIERCLPHEVVHITGCLNIRFLREGLDSILIAEYINGNGKLDSYLTEAYLTEIIIELAGKDTVLEAFSKGNDEILIQKMSESVSRDEVVYLLDVFEGYSMGDSDFFLTLETFIDYVQKIDLDLSKEAYLYHCLGLTLMDDAYLSKFWYNKQKSRDYPDLSNPESIIHTFTNWSGSSLEMNENEHRLKK